MEGVDRIEENGKTHCIVNDSCFIPPASYTLLGEIILHYVAKVIDCIKIIKQSY